MVDVEVSPEKQKEILSSLLREHTSVDMKFERERTRQEDLVSCPSLFCRSWTREMLGKYSRSTREVLGRCLGGTRREVLYISAG